MSKQDILLLGYPVEGPELPEQVADLLQVSGIREYLSRPPTIWDSLGMDLDFLKK